MSDKALETWAWVLLYGGLLALCLSVFLLRADAVLGSVVAAAGGISAAAGVGMIWWRSRRGK